MLLIDEVDRVEVETEALLLEILSDYQVSIPELGTVQRQPDPAGLPDVQQHPGAVARRSSGGACSCTSTTPSLEREKEIVLTRVPGITEHLADQIVRIVRSIRTLELKKHPSVSETLDWARTLVLLGIDSIDADQAKETLNILLKYQSRHHQGGQGAAGGGQVTARRPEVAVDRLAPCGRAHDRDESD